MQTSDASPDKRSGEIDFPCPCDDCGQEFLTPAANDTDECDPEDLNITPDVGYSINDGNVSFLELTAFQRDVLLACYSYSEKDTDPNGRQIRNQLEHWGYDELSTGRFYPTLDKLVDFGLIVKRQDMEDMRINRYEPTQGADRLLKVYFIIFHESVKSSLNL